METAGTDLLLLVTVKGVSSFSQEIFGVLGSVWITDGGYAQSLFSMVAVSQLALAMLISFAPGPRHPGLSIFAQ